MTERASRLAAWGITAAAGALLIIYVVAVISALSGCAYDPSGTGGDNAPETRDAGVTDKGFGSSPAAPALLDEQLAVQLCEGECSLKRAAGCDTLDSAYELGFCISNCDDQVAAIPTRCLDEYTNLRFCYAYSPAPVFVCTATATTSPIARDTSRCTPLLIALTACRIGSW